MVICYYRDEITEESGTHYAIQPYVGWWLADSYWLIPGTYEEDD